MSGLVVETSVNAFNESIGNGRLVPLVLNTATPLVSARTNSYIVVIQALPGNVNPILIGGSGVTTLNGIALNPSAIAGSAGGDITINVKNLADIYIISSNAGDGVRFAYWRPF